MKTLLLTLFATLSVVALLGSLFLNTLLGAFGLVATSTELLQRLTVSQRVVEQMRSRHQQKKLQLTKRLSTKASRRVASTALAAATIGTVAVAMTVTSLEIADYCEQKEALQEDENILYGSAIEFDLEQCFEEGAEESKAILSELQRSSVSAVADAFAAASDYSAAIWLAIKQAGMQALSSGTAAAEGWWDDTAQGLTE